MATKQGYRKEIDQKMFVDDNKQAVDKRWGKKLTVNTKENKEIFWKMIMKMQK